MSLGNRISKIATSTTIHNGQDQSENVPPQAKKVGEKSIKFVKIYFIFMNMDVLQPFPSFLNHTKVTNNRMSLATQNQTNQQAMSNAAAGRRSYVVKEVERLKENREKRRARQLEMKEEKNALMNMDPGNPNWELAAMIR